MEKYDVVIIGGGIGGLMAAYKLIQKNELKIAIIEKGNSLDSRNCPMITNRADKCLKCEPCAVMHGMAGAGAFSDGKFIITTEYGGWLSDFINSNEAISYMKCADDILVSFGATEKSFAPNEDLLKLCLANGLNLKSGIVKHFGTENNIAIMQRLIDYISDKAEIYCNSTVIDVDKKNNVVKLNNDKEMIANNIIFAVGRGGSKFFIEWCKKNEIEVTNNSVDVGVRVELPSVIWKEISNQVYDPKISYRSKKYGDNTRMFCFNDGGHVVTENTNGVLTVNGHAYANEEKKSQNSNFALLSSINFTLPFDKPMQYIEHIAGVANFIGNGGPVVQRFGDLLNNRRTTELRLKESTVRPTLKASPGDLSLCIPKRQLDNIIETIIALNKIAPGTANYDTLLYGVECKYYSARPKLNGFELYGCKNMYACGDGAGITRSLAQAAANGLCIADQIIEKSNVN
ncbi:MAG: FAD-binding protein [Tissierellia bacterium]|nr:FAD-binding protein [Tissierellia bacterium]